MTDDRDLHQVEKDDVPPLPSSPSSFRAPLGRPAWYGASPTPSFNFLSGSAPNFSAASQRAPFKSRLIDPNREREHLLRCETKLGKQQARKNFIACLVPVLVGLVGAAALIVTGYLSIKKHDYCLVLEDNFDGPLDTTIWKHEQETGGFGNSQFDWTTDSANNSYTKDGMLYIVPTLTADSIGEAAIMNGYQLNLTTTGTCTASNTSDPVSCSVASNLTEGIIIPPIQSARLTTKGTKSIKYGKVEVRARMPTGDWLWPAIWMMPRDEIYGPWPRSGEIDIVESKGNMPTKRSQELANVVSSTLHWGPISYFDGYRLTHDITRVYRKFFNQKFYTFGMEWDEEGITVWKEVPSRPFFITKFKVDRYELGGFPRFSDNGTAIVSPWGGSSNKAAAPFDQEFYLILNVAAGGTNGYFEDGDISKPWSNSNNVTKARSDFWAQRNTWLPTWPSDPSQRGMVVDYVKMWQLGKCTS
ncbi:AT18611P-RELATED [Ceraceosorus bombacis]|uniref:AT18611P-RELATED n=1 Tax=Ceraceosorus bombacis TaxID=401625 RepID=A0A0P1BGX3_9BASI|nr:AT18611P-RELATED [Ceraceosorus bombacis]